MRGAKRAIDLFGDTSESFRYAVGKSPSDSAVLVSDWQEIGADFDDAVADLNGRQG